MTEALDAVFDRLADAIDVYIDGDWLARHTR